ncbi:MAG TPA: hypothetical protein VMR02_19255 [Terracidiphilus sp.]|jgi:hypothetical protein|nr:hypothetical protein [Terracidiphilus sp.]
MALSKLGVIVWLLIAILVSGFCEAFAGRILQMPLAIVHKLLAVLCLILLLRIPGTVRALQAPPVTAMMVVFGFAYLAAFVTGAVQSIPACASSFWLNLHRVAAGISVIACAVAARCIAMAVRS